MTVQLPCMPSADGLDFFASQVGQTAPAQASVKIDRSLIAALMRQGKAHVKAKNFVEALQCFDKVIVMDRDDPDALNSAGNMNQYLGNTEGAFRCYNRALKMLYDGVEKEGTTPAYRIWCTNTAADLHFNYAGLLYTVQKPEDGEQHFFAALKIVPTHKKAREAVKRLKLKREGAVNPGGAKEEQLNQIAIAAMAADKVAAEILADEVKELKSNPPKQKKGGKK